VDVCAHMVLWYGLRKSTLKFEVCGCKDNDQVHRVVGRNAFPDLGFGGAKTLSLFPRPNPMYIRFVCSGEETSLRTVTTSTDTINEAVTA
jgi:hypothetical protein